MKRRSMSAILRLVIAACLLVVGFPQNPVFAGPGPQTPVTSVKTSGWESDLSVSAGGLIDNEDGTYSLWVDNSQAPTAVTITYSNVTNNVNSEDLAEYQKVSYGALPSGDWTSDMTNRTEVEAEFSATDGSKQDVYFRISEEQIKVTVHFLSVTTDANVSNTDEYAYLQGTVNGFDIGTTVGFEYSQDASFAIAPTTETQISSASSYIGGSLTGLERGKTYYYRAYAKFGNTYYYGTIQSFKTSAIIGIDVKDGSGRSFTKTPAAFDYATTTYEVHVPNDTTSVNVIETVDLGTAMNLQDLAFEVGGVSSTKQWVADGAIRTATKQVDIASDTTTVCVAYAASMRFGTLPSPCGPDRIIVKIIRDAAITAPPATTTTSTATLVLDTNPNETNQSAKTAITQIVGKDLKMSATLLTSDGKKSNLPDITIGADGSFNLTNVPAGVYQVALNVLAPTGEKLAGRMAKLTVNGDGTAKLEAGLIDPYGVVTDSVTGQKIDGARVTLYWSDTELNRAKGRKPGDMVVLPELPDFAPNKNHDPQSTVNGGQYGWMVFPDGDYYVVAEQEGYDTFDSRKDNRNENQGDDSYIKDGNIHVGQSIVKYDFKMKPTVVGSGEHKPYMKGYPDGSFLPERGITRAETAAILRRLFADEAAPAKTVSFKDVKSAHWAANDIAAVTAKKWMIGYPDGNFHPDQQVTRAELAQILLNVKKWNGDAENTFADAKGHWAEKAIGILQAQGLITGYPDGTFRPNDSVKRVEADVVFNQLTGRKPWSIPVAQKWTDVAPGYWGYEAIMEASVPHAYEEFKSGLENWTK